jgi:hypothetical protein
MFNVEITIIIHKKIIHPSLAFYSNNSMVEIQLQILKHTQIGQTKTSIKSLKSAYANTGSSTLGSCTGCCRGRLTAVVDKVPQSHEMFLLQMVDLCVPHACNFQR